MEGGGIALELMGRIIDGVQDEFDRKKYSENLPVSRSQYERLPSIVTLTVKRFALVRSNLVKSKSVDAIEIHDENRQNLNCTITTCFDKTEHTT